MKRSRTPAGRMDYLSALGLAHRILEPANYCEIGCRFGASLALATAPSVGIDPAFEITAPLAAPTRLFRMTSDAFFAQPDVRERLGDRVDFGFIDGLHQVESALRDFINLEQVAAPRGVVAIDDLLPERMEYATRDRHTRIWTGDVYRLVPLLRHYRPDLEIRVYDVDLKGFGLVSRLDPSSRVLADQLPAILEELAAGRWTRPTVEEIRWDLRPEDPSRLEADLTALQAWRRSGGAAPRLSVIVCTYDMPREAPRTLLSAGTPYQRQIAHSDYEVLVVDNGSRRPFPRTGLPEGVRVVPAPAPHPSPVFAINWAARELARGDILLFAIDGARIFSDRLYRQTLRAHDLVSDAFVFTLAWHLGPDIQAASMHHGYDEAAEDRLLARAGWPARPDALWDISVLAGSSLHGFFQPVAESNAFSVPRALFDRCGGFDERFVSPGGGLANLEIFSRYVTRPGARNICLLSEGTFHQIHGGVATSGRADWSELAGEYQAIMGRPYERPRYDRLYFGTPRAGAARFVRDSLADAAPLPHP
jgi:hypothetical protein